MYTIASNKKTSKSILFFEKKEAPPLSGGLNLKGDEILSMVFRMNAI